jgi:transposase
LREVARGLRWIVRTGAQWHWLPHDLPPCYTVSQQTQRWLRAGVFEDPVHDLRAVLRLAAGRAEAPSAALFDARALQSSPESGASCGRTRGNPTGGSVIVSMLAHGRTMGAKNVRLVYGLPSLCVAESQQYSCVTRRRDRHSLPCRRTKRTMS